MSGDWDAATYERVSGPQFGWALEQLERLPLKGDEVVLDAGCGTGRVTSLLAERVPRGRVYAVDNSAAMVEHARSALTGRASVLCQDLIALELPEPVDVAFSNASFHWIHDHDALFSSLARNMRPGARLVAQCGGSGNIASFRRSADEVAREEAFALHLQSLEPPWNYASETETAVRLERAGFTEVRTWLERKRVDPERAFVKTVCLLPYLNLLPEELHDEFLDRVLARGDWLDYVRLNMVAKRGLMR